MLKRVDVFEVLGISTNEDTFTNLMKYLFDHNHEFKINFINKFLNTDTTVSLENVVLLTRTTYIPETNERIIPDLVLYSKQLNEISVIEVKIHASQGKDQLKKYRDNVEIIKKAVGLKEDATENYYYLSIEEDMGKDNKDWNFVSWKKMEEVFGVHTASPGLYSLLWGVSQRIKSLKKKSDFEEVKNYSFNNYLRWNLWKSPGKTLEELITSHPEFKDILKEFDQIKSYTQFAPATNTAETTLILSKDSWQSELEYTDENCTVNNCYDFHIEIRISTDTERSYIRIRLDHHFNPYAPSSTMKEILGVDKYAILHNQKKEFIKEMKFKTYKDIGQKNKYRYNAARGDYLWIISKDEEFENQETIAEVLKFMKNEVEFLPNKIELFKQEVTRVLEKNE